jgi:TATA-binding protein-associated factor Taf7
MTKEIIELARRAGFNHGLDDPIIYAAHERFAKLVAEKEREACAKVCDDHWEKDGAAYYCALTIRYRGQA